MIFTTQQKDEWLKFLIYRPGNYSDNYRILTYHVLTDPNITLQQLTPLLEYFEELSFLRLKPFVGGYYYYFNQEAIDFLARGGFSVQEEMVKQH
jgi:hypothetical protein